MHGHGLGNLMGGEVSAKRGLRNLDCPERKPKRKESKNCSTCSVSRVALQRDVARFSKTSMERDGQLANLEQVLATRDSQITALNQATEERCSADRQSLSRPVAGRETQIAEHDELHR